MAGAVSQPVELILTAGLPYNRRFRVIDGVNVWPTEYTYEARSHIRVAKTFTSRLLFDLTPFLTVTIEGNDILVTLALTGEDTRAIAPGKGYYDIILSDVGAEDDRAISISSGTVTVKTIVTAGQNV